MLNSFQEVDIIILNFINRYFRFPLLDKLMKIITSLGNCGIAWIFLSIYLICNNRRKEGYMVIGSMILTAIVGEGIIKHITRRSRPVLKINQGTLLITKPMTYSFPSGHAASSFSVAGVFIMQNSNISIYVTILASLIAFSRLYLNVHYPSDVLTGVVLGLLCSIIVCDVINNIFVVY